MYGVAAGRLAGLRHFGDVEIGAGAGAWHFDRLVRLPHVEGPLVLPGMNGHRGDLQFGGGTGDANGDLATVGDEELHGRRGPKGAGC